VGQYYDGVFKRGFAPLSIFFPLSFEGEGDKGCEVYGFQPEFILSVA